MLGLAQGKSVVYGLFRALFSWVLGSVAALALARPNKLSAGTESLVSTQQTEPLWLLNGEDKAVSLELL